MPQVHVLHHLHFHHHRVSHLRRLLQGAGGAPRGERSRQEQRPHRYGAQQHRVRYNLTYSDHHDLEAFLPFPISLEKDDEARRPLKFREQARAIRAAQGTAAYVNNVGKAVFPVVLVVFTIFYFVLSLI